jgi:predicted metal-dependent hydrolase
MNPLRGKQRLEPRGLGAKVTLSPLELFRARVARWARRLRAQPRELRVLRMTRKWASCSARGRVCFSRALLDRSPPEQDYVIVHELLHLRHPNHGRVFRALLAAHVPGWRRADATLRSHAP